MDGTVNKAIGALAVVGGLELLGGALGLNQIPTMLGSAAPIVGGAAGLSALILGDRILGLSKLVK